MKIAKISIHNFLKLKDVEINPSSTNVITGKNKQGKTSILKAIKAAFTGDVDSTSIRVGGDKAEIILEMDDLNIKRTITDKGNYLDLSNKQGFKVPAPQKYLNGILGTFSFNPVEFFDLKPVDRKKYLLNAIKITITQDELSAFTGEKVDGLDYEAHALEVLEQARKFYYDRRTIANAESSKKKKSLEDMSSKLPEGFDLNSFDEAKIKEVREKIEINQMAVQKQKSLKEQIMLLDERSEEIKTQMAALNDQLERIKIKKGETQDSYNNINVAPEEVVRDLITTLENMEKQREHVFTAKQVEAIRTELDTAMKEAGKLDDIVKKLTKEAPETLIKKTNLPIEGLSISGDDILINNISIDNLSSSEQLKFGLQIVRALNGEFKVICIDGIESLDKETFEFFLKEIEGDEYQYFVTRVSETSANSIVVDNGEIVPEFKKQQNALEQSFKEEEGIKLVGKTTFDPPVQLKDGDSIKTTVNKDGTIDNKIIPANA